LLYFIVYSTTATEDFLFDLQHLISLSLGFNRFRVLVPSTSLLHFASLKPLSQCSAARSYIGMLLHDLQYSY